MFDLDRLEVFHDIRNAIGTGTLRISGCVPSQMEHFLWQLGDGFDGKVIITFDEQKARELMTNYQAFDRQCVYYPAKDPLFDQADIRGTYLSEQRFAIQKRLFSGEKLTVITTLDAFAERLSSFEDIEKNLIVIKEKEVLDVPALAERLVELGYENELQVEAHGEFSLRGNIIDIFPYTEDDNLYLCRYNERLLS